MDDSYKDNNFDVVSELVEPDVEDEYILWERKRREAIIQVVCYIAYVLCLISWYSQSRSVRRLTRKRSLEVYMERERRRNEVMEDLKVPQLCRGMIRMSLNTFANFCKILRDGGYLSDTRLSSVEEQVAKSLYIMGHNSRNFSLRTFFKRSGETVSRHLHRVLNAIIAMEDKFLKQPTRLEEVPLEISNNSRFYPYFKDCVGAIDGTHIHVKVPRTQARRFRGRNGYTSYNVLGVCSSDLKFTYALVGWEGSASDSRVLNNALNREDRLIIPRGKYLLGDAGYALKASLLTPYRAVRYHLKEYSIRGPETMQELFNLRHASLRNAIERTCGVLKKRFAIIAENEPQYSLRAQCKIILACIIFHNYLMGVDPDLSIIDKVDRELLDAVIEENETLSRDNDSKKGAKIRDDIAKKMWDDYKQNLQNVGQN